MMKQNDAKRFYNYYKAKMFCQLLAHNENLIINYSDCLSNQLVLFLQQNLNQKHVNNIEILLCLEYLELFYIFEVFYVPLCFFLKMNLQHDTKNTHSPKSSLNKVKT